MGVLTSLEDDGFAQDDGAMLNQETRLELIHSAAGQARTLNRLVGNLLDMTRLQAGAVRLNLALTDVQELVGAVLAQMQDRAQGRKIEVDVPDDMPMATMDAVLIGQVLINLLDNALKFSAADFPVRISASVEGNQLNFYVQDHGPGIADEERTRIFDKFYRGNTAGKTGGTGLGLAISRGIIEAHQGQIWAENIPGGGFQVAFSIPFTSPWGR